MNTITNIIAFIPFTIFACLFILFNKLAEVCERIYIFFDGYITK